MLPLRLPSKIAEGLFPSPSDSVHTTIGEADASIRVPEFPCMSAVLETGGLLPEWLALLQPPLLRMLATCHLNSWVGLQLADLRMVLLPVRKTTGATSTLCSYGVRLRTFDLFLPAVVARGIQLSKT